MGGLFSAPKAPVAPTKDNAAVEEAARRRKLQILQGGRATTVLTKAGETDTGSLVKTTLGRE